MNAKEVMKFFVMPENEPARSCSCCGGIAHWPDMQQAKIFPFTNESEDVCFVACSEACRQAFINYPTLDHFIMKAVQEFQLHKNLELKIEYRLWFQKIDQITSSN